MISNLPQVDCNASIRIAAADDVEELARSCLPPFFIQTNGYADPKQSFRQLFRQKIAQNVAHIESKIAECLDSRLNICENISNDIDIMTNSVSTNLINIRNVRANIPLMVRLWYFLTHFAIKNKTTSSVIRSSREQRLPQHLINRMMAQKLLHNSHLLSTCSFMTVSSKPPGFLL